MRVKPNKTIIRGRIHATRTDPSGTGRELDVHVSENRSPTPELDFLQPKPGGSITLYSTEAATLAPGDHVEIEATLLAGPFGERAVTQRIKKLGA